MNDLKIMIIEGSDILKNNLDDINIKKQYKGMFVNSLLLDELIKIGLKSTDKDTTRDIIMVNFRYGYNSKKDRIKEKKLLKQLENNKSEIKNNVKLKKDLLKERKEQSNNTEKKVYTDKIIKLTEINKVIRKENKKLKHKIKDLGITKEQVREKLYNNGFHLDFYIKDKKTKKYKKDEIINYTFFFRSPSKSKVGSICFINKKLYNNIDDWQRMGINLPEENAKLVEMEAYKSLTSSGIENKITINPTTEILVVNDLNSYIKCMCANVDMGRARKKIKKTKYNIKKINLKIIKSKYNMKCIVKYNKFEKIKNTLWDGMALLENSLFIDYQNAGMMVLREHFFKICGFRTYIQKFMKNWCKAYNQDYNTYKVKDRYGRKLFVKNIKMITTENAMKWEKLIGVTKESYNYWCNKIQENNNVFGIVKTDHKSKYGTYQRMSFQMINSLPINKEQAKNLCQETLDYIQQLKNDNNNFIKHLSITANKMNANNMMIDLYNQNNDFAKTAFFRKFKNKTIFEYKETLRAGKLLTNADNLTVCGNPYMMLLHSVNDLDKYIYNDNDEYIIDNYEDKTLPILDTNSKVVSCYTKRFNNEYLAGFRSPHNSPNNIMYFKNYKHKLINTYFNFSANIIAVNLVKTNSQDRGNGFDEDSDFFYVSNNRILIEASEKAQDYPTIVNKISKNNNKYNNDMKDLAKIDNTLAQSKYDIGLSSNLAQLALSWYWKYGTQELADIVCILSVLAQVAIDSSKRTFDVNVGKEIERIIKLDCMQMKIDKEHNLIDYKDKKLKLAKPYFWQFIKEIKDKQVDKVDKDDEERYQKYIIKKIENTKNKNNKTKKMKEHCIEEKLCPMDYIQDVIDKIPSSKNKDPYKKDTDFIRKINGKANLRKMNKIEQAVKKLDNMYRKYFAKIKNGEQIDDDEWEVERQLKTDETFTAIKKIKNIDEKTMQMIIKNTLSDKKNKKYKRRLLDCLYKINKELFLSIWY